MVSAIRAMKIFARIICLVALAAALFPWAARATILDDIGVTALRAVATNVDGGGIRVAQPEANTDGNTNHPSAFEVNPGAVGRPTNLFSYASLAGTATNFPNGVGNVSGHANDVANNFYGISGGVATNVARVDNSDADFFINYYIISNLTTLDATVVNQSFTFGTLTAADQRDVDSAYDDYAAAFGTLFVSAACNADISLRVCAPGTAYNCISVGSYKGNSSIGPTIDNNRCKPEITAPIGGGGTSFTTPLVSGAAAVLLQAALRGDGGGDTNAACDLRTIKALLLNGAVKPLDWTNANNSPLDARYGAGVLNVLNSYEQLADGRHGGGISTNIPVGTAHPPLVMTNLVAAMYGWDLNTNTSSATDDNVCHYFFNLAGDGTRAATITLVWNRQLAETNINDLDLFLFNAANSNLVAWSTSRVDNVEHIYVPQLAAGRYDVQVLKNGGTGVVSDAETFALAWEFVSPVLQMVKTGTNSVLRWPVYPAGFIAEARTNLLAGTWSTNGVSLPGITNGLNNIPLNTTNAVQFFRLRKPNL